MELLGGAEDFKFQSRNGAVELTIIPVDKDVSNLNTSHARPFATLRAKSKNEIDFHWDKNQLPGDNNGDVRRRLRDCVLKITSSVGEVRHCIFRSQPPGAQDLKQFNVRLKKERIGSLTHHRYNWDSTDAFKGTSRKIEIAQCKLLERNCPTQYRFTETTMDHGFLLSTESRSYR